ncbi:universal stress protein [Salinimicrobium terrae]|uniref:universal stress protein n=1 Tax=Salinimicrobium terrae TaxID=470866 RepID=UPI00040FDB2A|nr:universal stress protein [Salinimicrobium terrae]
MKKIIYATDFSENSVAALRYATELARVIGDDLIALHVYPPQETEKLGSDFLKEHQKELQGFCKLHLGEIYDPQMISPAVVSGPDVAEEILKFTKDLQVRMIVMGACGASKLKDRFVGTTTNEMIGKSYLPILAVPPHFTFKQPQNIFFASTFDDQELIYLKELIPLAKSLNAKIEVVHITHKKEDEALKNLKMFQEKIESEIPYSNIDYKTLYSSEVFDTLRKAIEKDHPDIVMMPEKRNMNLFKRGLVRDRIKRMQSCSPIPLLTFPAFV